MPSSQKKSEPSTAYRNKKDHKDIVIKPRYRVSNKQRVLSHRNTLKKQEKLNQNKTRLSKKPPSYPQYTAWIAIAFVIFILIAFFWPTEENKAEEFKEIAISKQQVESGRIADSFYSVSRIDPQPDSQNNFTQDNDISRVKEFREEEKKQNEIKQLIQSAESAINKGYYTQPNEDNALQLYRKVLQLDSTHQDALNGIEKIKNYFLHSGISALQKNKPDLIEKSLNKLAEIEIDSSQHNELNLLIRENKTNQWIQKAQLAFQNNLFILPARENALYYYQQALIVDPENQKALQGIETISNKYAEKAITAIGKKEYSQAKAYLSTISAINPDHSSLASLLEVITSAELTNNHAFTPPSSINNTEAITKPIPENTKPVKQSTPTNISTLKTSSIQTSEQEAFDREYLKKGLQAYYAGEYDTAVLLLQPLADKGISRAQFRIGYMHYLGRGFTKNIDEADRIIRSALPAIKKFVKEGRSWAQSDLASLYEDGLVLAKDYSNAIFLYRSAAEQGYAGAQTNLGIMYAQGKGVKQNVKTAIAWFKKAAAQGDIAAINNLKALNAD